jgi:Glycosyltransferases, probably involved in cell wall biogenesis
MIEPFLIAIQHTGAYWWALVFFAAYPIVTSIMWITTAMLFRWRWERAPRAPAAAEAAPFVSVMVPAHNEREVIARSVAAMLRIDYPAFEVIVIDDGSTDGTLEALQALAADPRLRLVRKQRNESKRWR